MTRSELLARLEEAFGLPGVFAAESSDLTDRDLARGFDHCVEKIAPALEDELANASE